MSEPAPVVLDASAFLAYLYAEPGAEMVRDALASGCRMSAVNWAEVLSTVAAAGGSPADLVARLTESRLLDTALRVEAFGARDAALVAELRPRTRAAGLSLGDRACIALVLSLGDGASVLTSDRAWRAVAADLGCRIEWIR